jgi:hypothetical protein
VTEAVEGRALGVVGQHFVGFLDLFELRFRRLIARIAVRVKFHGEPAICLLDVGFGRVALDAEHLVVVAFRHVGLFLLLQMAPPRAGAPRR